MKTFLMVWSVFNYLLTQKLPTKAKVALGCSQYVYTKSCWKRKSCSKVVEHNLFMPKHEGVDVRTIFSEPKFLGSVDYHIFLPMVLGCARFARENSANIIHTVDGAQNTIGWPKIPNFIPRRILNAKGDILLNQINNLQQEDRTENLNVYTLQACQIQ